MIIMGTSPPETEEDVPLSPRPSRAQNAIKKVAETYHDQVATNLAGWGIGVLLIVWFIDFAWIGSNPESEMTGQVIDLLRTIITASMGYLFASHKYGKNDKS